MREAAQVPAKPGGDRRVPAAQLPIAVASETGSGRQLTLAVQTK